MRKRSRIIAFAAAALLLAAAPLYAVLTEQDLGKTLHVLRFELAQEYDRMSSSQSRLSQSHEAQHRKMVSIMKKCNELALMLYSQKQDFTFDMTYALKSVTQEYDDFNKTKMPYDEIVQSLDIEINRYSRLLESLRRLPPELVDIEGLPDSLLYHNDSIQSEKVLIEHIHDEHMHDEDHHDGEEIDPEKVPPFEEHMHDDEGDISTFVLDEDSQQDRDSCIFYASALLQMYQANKDHIVEDSEHYDDVSMHLKESYDYATDRYRHLQKKIFVQGQNSFLKIMTRNPKMYWRRAVMDMQNKYGTNAQNGTSIINGSEWRGKKILAFIWVQFLLLMACGLVCWLFLKLISIKVHPMQTVDFHRRLPVIAMLCGVILFALVVMTFSAVVKMSFFQMAAQQMLVYAWLLAAIIASLLIYLDADQVRSGLMLFLPMMILAMLVIGFRVIFIPNSMMSILLPPVILIFLIWQVAACIGYASKVSSSDRIISWVSVAIIVVAAVFSFVGHSFVGLLILIWWFFQLACIETLIAIYEMLEMYSKNRLSHKVDAYKETLSYVASSERKNMMALVTWFYDLVRMVVIPVLAVCSIPLCLYLALNVFDFKELFQTIFRTSLLNLSDASGTEILHLSMRRVVAAVSLYFIFKYIAYIAHSIYMRMKFASYMQKNNSSYVRSNDVNLSLGRSVISIIVWFLYILIVIYLLKIPTGSLTVVAGGLSAGIGLALKDVINNFIYGIQLMSGRLRTGDWIEVDGIRGKVTGISYQSTQIETVDGAVMSFLNTTLFNQNFKNLTRNNSFELIKLMVGVSYGTDVENVRSKLLAALNSIDMHDQYGRDVLDRKRGIKVEFDEFGDSSVNIAVKQYVLVTERYSYAAKAKEVIYNTLNENGIEIPFPQRDIHVISNS